MPEPRSAGRSNLGIRSPIETRQNNSIAAHTKIAARRGSYRNIGQSPPHRSATPGAIHIASSFPRDVQGCTSAARDRMSGAARRESINKQAGFRVSLRSHGMTLQGGDLNPQQSRRGRRSYRRSPTTFCCMMARIPKQQSPLPQGEGQGEGIKILGPRTS